jgi:hypothetical protein
MSELSSFKHQNRHGDFENAMAIFCRHEIAMGIFSHKIEMALFRHGDFVKNIKY